MGKHRANNEGTVRKRADGRWEGILVVGHKDNGDPITKSVFGKTQKEVVRKLQDAKEVYKDADLTEAGNMTLQEWLDKWWEEYEKPRIKPTTQRMYQRSMQHIPEELADKKLRALKKADFQKLYADMSSNGRKINREWFGSGLAPATVRHLHFLLHNCLKAAVKDHLIPTNPTQDVPLPKLERAEMKVLNDSEMDVFMDEIRKDPIWYDFFYTAITTGLRKGEICGLMWSDLDFRTGKLKIRRNVVRAPGGELEIGTTKTNNGTRTIVLPASTLQLLKEKKKHALSQWMFPDPLAPEKPMSPDKPYKRLKQILRDASLPDIRFHDLRHTFATHAMANGVDAKTLSQILGHGKASFTLDTYTHVTTDMHRQAAKVVGSFMNDLFGEDLQPWRNGKVGAED